MYVYIPFWIPPFLDLFSHRDSQAKITQFHIKKDICIYIYIYKHRIHSYTGIENLAPRVWKLAESINRSVWKVDRRRHGKRPLHSEASSAEEIQEGEDDLHTYGYTSPWSETDVSAMVTALAQVMGTGHGNQLPATAATVDSTQAAVSRVPPVEEVHASSHLPPNQGNEHLSIYIYLYIYAMIFSNLLLVDLLPASNFDGFPWLKYGNKC